MKPDVTALKAALAASGVPGVEPEEHPTLGVVVRVPTGQAGPVMLALRDAGYNYLVDTFGIDTGEQVDVVYFLRSMSRDEELRVRMFVPYGGTLVSMFDIYHSGLYPERELAEMFGLTLEDHPNPKRLLTNDDLPWPLLLKTTPIRTEAETHERDYIPPKLPSLAGEEAVADALGEVSELADTPLAPPDAPSDPTGGEVA